MGGPITVMSNRGVGSTFTATIRAPSVELIESTDADSEPRLKGKSVVIVDGSATNRRSLLWHMNKWGLKASATGQPKEALAWVEAGQTFDVALLDLDMPDLNGVSLSREMRRAHASLPTRFVLLSSPHSRLADIEADFDAVLSKPIPQQPLFAPLAGALTLKPIPPTHHNPTPP